MSTAEQMTAAGQTAAGLAAATAVAFFLWTKPAQSPSFVSLPVLLFSFNQCDQKWLNFAIMVKRHQ